MKKTLLTASLVLATGFFTLAEAKVVSFQELVNSPEKVQKLDLSKDKIAFSLNQNDHNRLMYKQREDGIEFKLDNGEGNTPRYQMLGKLAIQICPSQYVPMTKTRKNEITFLNLQCGK